MIYDDILKSNLSCLDFQIDSSYVLESIKNAVVISIDNVVEYLTSADKIDCRKFYVNAAPPFPDMWIEWDSFEEKKHFFYFKDEEYGRRAWLIHSELRNGSEEKWESHAMLFVSLATFKGIIGYVGNISYKVKADGSMDEDCPLQIRIPSRTADAELGDEKYTEEIIKLLIPSFASLAFMHCKNIEVCEEKVSRQVRRWNERHGQSTIKKYTLKISPIKKIIKQESGEDHLTSKALHICRGHFKNFNEHGLFGKYMGTYWWPMQTRGNSSFGIVEKKYNVTTGNNLSPVDFPSEKK